MKPKPLNWDTPLKAAIPIEGDLSQATLKCQPIHWTGRRGSLQLVWTGTPTGTLTVSVSNNHDPMGAADNGTWTDIAVLLSPPISQPAGAAGNAYIDLATLAAGFLKVSWARTSGSGTLTGFVDNGGA